MRYGSCFVVLCLLLSGCVFDSNKTDHSTARYTKTLPFNVAQISDEGFYGDDVMWLEWYEYPDDNFFLVESPEMIDSLFEYVYPNTDFLSSLFPENGMLLIHVSPLPYGWSPGEHILTLEGNTIILDEYIFTTNTEQSGGWGRCFSVIGLIPAI